MNGLAYIQADTALRLANDRAAELRRQVELERQVTRRSSRSPLGAIAEAISVFSRQLAIADDERLTPALNNYPYRA
jgi:hypothetical protein